MSSFFFYHLKKQLYYLYHIILQYTLHPKTLLFYFFIKILFLIFLYYFFPIITFFQDSNGKIFLGFRTFFFFFPDLHSPTVTFFLGYATLFFFQQWCWFQWPFLGLYHFFPTIVVFFFFFKLNNYSKQPNNFISFISFRKNQPNINALKLTNFKYPHTYIFHQNYQISI